MHTTAAYSAACAVGSATCTPRARERNWVTLTTEPPQDVVELKSAGAGYAVATPIVFGSAAAGIRLSVAHFEPDHSASQPHFPEVHTPLRLQSQSLLQGESGPSGAAPGAPAAAPAATAGSSMTAAEKRILHHTLGLCSAADTALDRPPAAQYYNYN